MSAAVRSVTSWMGMTYEMTAEALSSSRGIHGAMGTKSECRMTRDPLHRLSRSQTAGNGISGYRLGGSANLNANGVLATSPGLPSSATLGFVRQRRQPRRALWRVVTRLSKRIKAGPNSVGVDPTVRIPRVAEDGNPGLVSQNAVGVPDSIDR
jgi:hypothetical protein